MGWTTTSVVTTQVMDKNPMTWLNAAANSFYESNFMQGLERIDKALEFGKSNSDVLVRGYAYKILILYGLKKNSDARLLFERTRSEVELDAYLTKNVDIVVTYLRYDSNYWNRFWEQLIDRKEIEDDYSFFEKYANLIPQEKRLSKLDMARKKGDMARKKGDYHWNSDPALAVYWYMKAAEKGNSDAAFALSRAYTQGRGVPHNQEKAEYWYQVGQGKSPNLKPYNVPKKAATLQQCEMAASQGDVNAMRKMGDYRWQGDPASAVYWYMKAAEEGDSWSAERLAEAYEKGQGVPINRQKATFWRRKAQG